MKFLFQESKIWDGAGQVDPNGKKVWIKARNQEHAIKQINKRAPSLGRKWILMVTQP